MDMPTSLADFVLTRHNEQARLLEAYVEGKLIRFPSHHANAILLHGQYGSGKTLLASILPILIELARADNNTKQEYDFRYQYMGEDISVTPNNAGKELLHADIKFIACGGESANHKQKSVSQIRDQLSLSHNWSASAFRYFVFDEVDEWNSAQSDLKSLVTSADTNTIFIFTTNFLHKIDKGLQSRCIKFEMNKINPSDAIPLIRKYYPFTNTISDRNIENVVREGNSDWREIKRLMAEVQLAALTK